VLDPNVLFSLWVRIADDTPGAGYVSIAASIVIGVVASGASSIAVHWTSKSTLDDTLDGFPCHGVGGLAGMVLTAIFAREGGLITGSPDLFLKHIWPRSGS